jgi:3-polyprenyl-4-hydroxybenzoate decarboxylase
MLVSKNEVTIRFTPGHDGCDFIKNAEKRGQKRFGVAVCIGVPSVYGIPVRATHWRLRVNRRQPRQPHGCRKMQNHRSGSAGACGDRAEGEVMIGRPATRTFRCGTHDTAGAERRIMTIKAMTHRKDPVYHNIWLGKPPHEHLYVDALQRGYRVSGAQTRLSVLKAYAPPWGFLCIDSQLEIVSETRYRGQHPRGLALHAKRQMETCGEG